MLTIPHDVKERLVAKAREILEEYDNDGIDVWDSVMVNDVDGYDINVYQYEQGSEIRIIAYEVKDLNVTDDYAVYQNITNDVFQGEVKWN